MEWDVCVSIKPLSHRDSGKYTGNVFRHLSRIVRFAAFTLPVIFRNLCVHSHTTRKDPVKTRDLSCDVYNARSPFSLNWRMISASARIVRSSLIACFIPVYIFFVVCER